MATEEAMSVGDSKVEHAVRTLAKMAQVYGAHEFQMQYEHFSIGELPYEVRETGDRGFIPIPFAQMEFPAEWETVLNALGQERASLIRVVDDGSSDCVVDVPATKELLWKQQRRFARTWVENLVFTTEAPATSVIEELLESNKKRWLARGIVQEPGSLATTLLRLAHVFGPRTVYYVWDASKLIAVIETQDLPSGPTYWVNTYLCADANRSGLGNTCLLYLMLQHLGHSVDLGISILEYKALWKPRITSVKGFDWL